MLKDETLDRYYLRRGDYTQTFDVGAYDAERLLDAVKALMESGARDPPEVDGENASDFEES